MVAYASGTLPPCAPQTSLNLHVSAALIGQIGQRRPRKAGVGCSGGVKWHAPRTRARSAAKISKINSSNRQGHPSTSAARWRFCDVRFLFGKRTRAGGGIPACPADSGLSVSSVLLPVLPGPLEQAQKPCLILSPS